MSSLHRRRLLWASLLLSPPPTAAFLAAGPAAAPVRTELRARAGGRDGPSSDGGRRRFFGTAGAAALSSLLSPVVPAARADEIGVNVDAPTLPTGEEVEICTKRGPLGKCERTEVRTVENDNDRASKYMKNEGARIQERDMAMRETANADAEGSVLIQKLMRQTEENKERNEKIVASKTLANDQSAILGPFDQSVMIMNSDGGSYTVLENAQAMRLKKRGYIKGKRFVTMPTEDDLALALVPGEDEGLDGIISAVKGVFGGGK